MSINEFCKTLDIISPGNKLCAGNIRRILYKNRIFLINIISLPGAGKTSLIINTIKELKHRFRIGVFEINTESKLDSQKISGLEVITVHIKSNNVCSANASIIKMALLEIGLDNIDMVLAENHLKIPESEFHDYGAFKNVMLSSITEGDDKPLKYSHLFTNSDIILLNKMDYLKYSDFNLHLFRERISELNKSAEIIEISCRTRIGMISWIKWLNREMEYFHDHRRFPAP